jgi:hypothetical protein
VSLYTVVSRGMWGRLEERQRDRGARVVATAARSQEVRLPGASMHVLEACLALAAIATAVLIGFGR